MYLRRFSVKNIRSISTLEMEFDKGGECGWHVILGENGSGKSSIVRSFALLVMGEKESYASRQDYSRWIRQNCDESEVAGTFSNDSEFDSLAGGGAPPTRSIQAKLRLVKTSSESGSRVEIEYTGERTTRTIWGSALGWFSASFGPFRRFTGGDRIYDRIFVSNKRLAPHLTALGEDVALTEALGWLTTLHGQALQEEKYNESPISQTKLNAILQFLNDSSFFPHNAKIQEVTTESVLIIDGNQNRVPIDQLSDGYRSALSMTLELVRQMFELYGDNIMLKAMTNVPGTVVCPGVVFIDEVDAHLHPSWQKKIGRWLTTAFPRIQFIVTTHSPIICRSIVAADGSISGSVWRLPAPGSNDVFRRVEQADVELLAYGDVLDAYGTELFGSNVTRSDAGNALQLKFANLNVKALRGEITSEEDQERKKLRRLFAS